MQVKQSNIKLPLERAVCLRQEKRCRERRKDGGALGVSVDCYPRTLLAAPTSSSRSNYLSLS